MYCGTSEDFVDETSRTDQTQHHTDDSSIGKRREETEEDLDVTSAPPQTKIEPREESERRRKRAKAVRGRGGQYLPQFDPPRAKEIE